MATRRRRPPAAEGANAPQLAALWALRSRDRGVPVAAIDHRRTMALVHAIATGVGVREEARRFGSARSQAGFSVQDTLDELIDLQRAWPDPGPEPAAWSLLISSAAQGWFDDFSESTLAMAYRDPCTGLPTVGYLDICLERLYDDRGSADAPTGTARWETEVLVVVRLGGQADLVSRMMDAARLCDTLALEFESAQMCSIAPGTFAGLFPRSESLHRSVWEVAVHLDGTCGVDDGTAPCCHAWVEPLPFRLSEARSLLMALSDPSVSSAPT
jgi:hypothetical protein